MGLKLIGYLVIFATGFSKTTNASRWAKTRETFDNNDLISPLKEWLEAYPQLEKANLRKRLKAVRIKAGFRVSKEESIGFKWANDVCRHTAITFRLAKENYAYGKCAVLFGNSEQVIRDHYQAFSRPKDQEVLSFYSILPNKTNK